MANFVIQSSIKIYYIRISLIAKRVTTNAWRHNKNTSIINYPIYIILNSKIKSNLPLWTIIWFALCIFTLPILSLPTSYFILQLLHFLYAYGNYFLFVFCLSEYIKVEKVVTCRVNLIIWHGVQFRPISHCKMHTDEGDISYCCFWESQFPDT